MKVTKNNKFGLKNKIKEKQNKQKDNKKHEQYDWFYMCPAEINVEMIDELVKEMNFCETEVWKEMDILEMTISDKASVDFELVRYEFKDESDKAFLEARGIKTIYSVTFSNCDIDILKPFIDKLLMKWEGVFCADTFDFNPRFENK